MTQRFFIPGLMPGLNEIIAAAKVRSGAWSKYGFMKERETTRIVVIINQAKLKPMKRVTARFLWLESTKRRDKDNIAVSCKFAFDALVAAGILANDGWKHIDKIEHAWEIDAQQPGVWVELEEVL